MKVVMANDKEARAKPVRPVESAQQAGPGAGLRWASKEGEGLRQVLRGGCRNSKTEQGFV